MKKVLSTLLAGALVISNLIAVNAEEALSDNIQIYYQENPAIIADNPGKGYERYGDASVSTSDKVLEYANIGYWRFPWFILEPNEGEYNWQPIDNFLEKWDEIGGRCAFGVMAVASSSSNFSEYMTPKWVFDSGAESLKITYAGGRIQYIPASWSDPVYLKKIDDFSKALAERYDGDRRIAYIDIRTCGNWGETHTLEMPSETPTISYEDIKNHIDIWRSNFQKTQLMINTTNWFYEKKKIEYAVSLGVGVRYDGVQARPATQYRLVPAVGKEPGTWEFWNPYQALKSQDPRKFKGWNVETYLQQFLIGKPSYADLGQYNKDPDLMIEDEEELVKFMTNKMGYHFILKDIGIPRAISSDMPFDISLSWKNSGVNRLYESCYTALAILDERNNIVSKCFLEGSDPKKWAPNEVTVENLNAVLGNLTDESYKLAIGLFRDKEDENPRYRIGNYDMTENKWYLLAELNSDAESGMYLVKAFPKVKVCGEYADDIYYEANGKRYVNYEKILGVFKILPESEPSENGILEFTYEGDTVSINCIEGTVLINGTSIYMPYPAYAVNDKYYISDEIFDLIGELSLSFDEGNNCIEINSQKHMLTNQSKDSGVIKDGGFENGTNAWSYSGDSFKISENDASEGKYSLYHSSRYSSGSAYQIFEIDYNTYYKLSFDAKGTVNYSLYDKSANLLKDDIQTEKGLSSDSWKTYSTTLGLDRNVIRDDRCFVQLKFDAVDGEDECWIDNIKLEKIGTFEELHEENEMFQDGGIESNRNRILPMNDLAYFERSRNNPHGGEFCGRIYDRNEQWSGIVLDYTEEFWEAGPGKYKFEGWFRTAEGNSEMTAYINYANNNILPGWSYTFNVGSEWTYVSTEVEVSEDLHSGIITAELFLLGDSNPANNTMDIFVDDLTLKKIGE
ncbi:MAG: DUF4832 domain-containing protein [Firmicutes bacterium]|nr:DUF4832 domain-containing protein [Bacillota bacterium]